jgi:plasmid stabilization system protein ParE
VSYPITWTVDAENDLATLWLDPGFRAALTKASQAVDEVLEAEGPEAGESRAGDRRILFAHPVGVYFRFDSGEGQVYVLNVWRIR